MSFCNNSKRIIKSYDVTSIIGAQRGRAAHSSPKVKRKLKTATKKFDELLKI
jgi:hypothetical protein